MQGIILCVFNRYIVKFHIFKVFNKQHLTSKTLVFTDIIDVTSNFVGRLKSSVPTLLT